ncbi:MULTISPECIES: DNA/RNA non-specific endonuclease [unclassified Novosphingobium]|uniref:DNA/RNA non-specific endonuclease n=1 Tax=unclassified Novosphingobium TaxID=2644732 RepID=UPI000ED9B90A|nr:MULTISPECIES: DNA/RNA non-specific endonuclease [unclassified Novosphingobium]HCF24640.1 hypothetical protein [Novosphingobium sp.]HQV04759.1 DNA/RNA non-specific endonuclease [Novosphingobium sp.]
MLATPNFDAAIRRAEQRGTALGQDLDDLKASVRSSSPEALASESEKRDRRNFLESLYDERREADAAFERIIQGNELQDASFLARGALVARTIMRVVLKSPGGATRGYGTGFLIGDGVLITNNHVLANRDQAEFALAEAFYERDIFGSELAPWRFGFDTSLFYTSRELDFTVVGLKPRSLNGREKIESLGWLPLIGGPGKAAEGEWLTIIQHPAGERKQLCVRENQLLKRDTDVLWYSTDTLAGSSGSPVFNNDWLLVALHHSGVPETKNGKWQTIDGHDYDPVRHSENDIKWKANEGIRVSRIVETIRTDAQAIGLPKLQAVVSADVQDLRARLPVLYRDGAGPPTEAGTIALQPTPFSDQPSPERTVTMPEQIVSLRLAVDQNGGVRLLDGAGSTESALLEAAKPKKNVISAPVDPARDWVKGFDPEFLGKGALKVNLPTVLDPSKIAPLRDAYGQTFTAAEAAAGVLNYDGYSVVMNKERRFAFYSAANVNAAMRTEISGREDDWLFDDRIDRAYQVDNSYYKGTKIRRNDFDRGHLTRREDMEWGESPMAAVRKANGTCTWTNCTPQHGIFNQNKDPTVELWHGLEAYILEQTVIHDQFKAQVITGPVFGSADPVFRNIPYPLEFWKVVVAVAASGKLFATAYLLSQEATIAKFGIEAAGEEPFGAFETYQCKIAKIEDLTGLKFTYGGSGAALSKLDPLETQPARRRRGSSAVHESLLGASSALQSLDDIDLGF